MRTTPQAALVIVTALVRLSYQYEPAAPAIAERVWTMAVVIADQHGLNPGDAVWQLQFQGASGPTS